jgi:hypothetical protein
MIDGKEAGIREGHNHRGRRGLLRRITMCLAATALREQHYERNAQKADFQRFAFHR